MTAKTLKKRRVIDCTRGLSRGQRAVNRRNKLESLLTSSCTGGPKLSSDDLKERKYRRTLEKIRKFHKMKKERIAADEKKWADEAAQFGILPERVVSDTPFKEEPFGDPVTPGMHLYEASENQDEMLFACSGLPLPSATTSQLDVTRFVTSACLVREFVRKRNRDDKLRVEVRLPDDTTTDGFLGLYDDDIAIVTSVDLLDVDPIDLDYEARPVCSDDHVIAAGRAFSSGSLRAISGVPCREHSNIWVPHSSHTTKAVLGGPLIGNEVGNMPRFLGMNLDQNNDKYIFLPLELLRERLEHFQILNPKVIHFDNYELPKGASTIIPSGFMESIYRIKALGYPLPPPLVLEFNGQLLNGFEDFFGELHAWKGYSIYGCCMKNEYTGYVWSRLRRKVFTKICRRVVSLASFKDGVRFFVCTGLLIKLCGRTVILTSASLVNREGSIDNNLKIEVFLPPKQRRNGTLEAYNLNYNIAIVSVEKGFHCSCPEDIFKTNLKLSEQAAVGQGKSSEKLVAIGRGSDGVLMGIIGEVKPTNEDRKFDCTEVRVSTCEINKAGIGGPLINLGGSFVGMNFYDGKGGTPFLPISKIVEVLQGVVYLPRSQGGSTIPLHIRCDDGWPTTINRWPVPQPYWYHGALDVDFFDIP
ncbi:unnamed protein product [Urochloa decumbens]|uniref:Uncharacterized protein n=1 Tax=Urochloa decumbens TaxID=240449 RepID=A0ABC9EUS5_9POAL